MTMEAGSHAALAQSLDRVRQALVATGVPDEEAAKIVSGELMRVFEALFCFGEPSATDADVLRAYLSLRWRLGLSFATSPDIAARLRALGVDPGALYATILILR